MCSFQQEAVEQDCYSGNGKLGSSVVCVAVPPGLPRMKLGRLEIPDREMEDLCRRWRVRELAVFGSVLRDDFGPESDVDLLVTFAPDAPWTLLDLVEIRDNFADLVGRPVDIIERSTVEASPNWIRRRKILSTARPIDVTG